MDELKEFVNRITTQPQLTGDITGLVKFRKELEAYLNNYKDWTKNELLLKKRQIEQMESQFEAYKLEHDNLPPAAFASQQKEFDLLAITKKRIDISLGRFEQKLPPKPKARPTLPELFAHDWQLSKLVDLLTANGFVQITKSGSRQWTGIKHETARGRGLQLVALSYVCQPFYKKTTYQQQELHHAWTTYFNYKVTRENWTEVKRPPEDSQYHRLFTNLLRSI
jgi:hypothetical protein